MLSTTSSPTFRTAGLAAIAGGAAYAFAGAIQAVHGGFGGDHNTIDSTAEYLVTGALPVSIALTIPAYRALAQLGRAPRAGLAAIVAQAVLALMTVVSVVNGEDAAVFNAVAPLCLLTWLVGSVVIARGLTKTGAVPRPLAIALPLLLIATFPLSPVGGPLLTGAFWLATGSLLAGLRTRATAAQAA